MGHRHFSSMATTSSRLPLTGQTTIQPTRGTHRPRKARTPSDTGSPVIPIRHNQSDKQASTSSTRADQPARKIEARTSVVIPRNNVRGWVNLGPGPARLLFTFVPGGIDELFPLIGQTSPDRWLELGQQHDTWSVGNPMDAH
ncbi:MAG: Cupin 2 conserved barrel domain protein [Mycobacterium sp.]|jgi:hypothetical protein|nr:Cupin 2 conserved barrel domain protein [Mycobacterium sp.]